jgi:MFS transporter, DHA2 family, multidrug resistance protein
MTVSRDALAVANGDQALIEVTNSAFDASVLVTMAAIVVALAPGTAITGRLLRHHRPGAPSLSPTDIH